jgi:hypothetical protein
MDLHRRREVCHHPKRVMLLGPYATRVGEGPMGRHQPPPNDARALIGLLLVGAAVTVAAIGMSGALAPVIAAGLVFGAPVAALGLSLLIRRHSRGRREPWEHFERAFWDYVRAEQGLPRSARPDDPGH